MSKKATANYGGFVSPKSAANAAKITMATCPRPECGKIMALSVTSCFPWHNNRYGFGCDASGYTPAVAATFQVDDQGRLINVDEMKKILPKETIEE